MLILHMILQTVEQYWYCTWYYSSDSAHNVSSFCSKSSKSVLTDKYIVIFQSCEEQFYFSWGLFKYIHHQTDCNVDDVAVNWITVTTCTVCYIYLKFSIRCTNLVVIEVHRRTHKTKLITVMFACWVKSCRVNKLKPSNDKLKTK